MNNSNQEITGKTALITGGARRIGRAIALCLAGAGVNVIIHYNSSSREAEEAAELSRVYGVRAWIIQANLSDIRETTDLIPQAFALSGSLDFLINNASVFPASNLTDSPLQELYSTLTVNAVAPLILSRQFVKQTSEGVIINMLDSRVKRYDLNHAYYQLSKNMLYSLTHMMALECAPGVRVNGVAPGLILPPPGKDEMYLDKQADRTLLNRHGSMDDIAHAVLFLLTNRFITGEVIFVEGGQNLKKTTYERDAYEP